MDVGIDFLEPEFLNLLFFQQKNLVIFPYIDLKHLHALETFAVGHNIIDIESTALYNMREIIEGETVNSYSQNPNIFLIYNLDGDKVKDIMKIEGIRCILSANENIGSLVNGESFIFYNKKTKNFLNYEFKNVDLEFEKYLISISKDQETLYDNIQKIKTIATRIFKKYVETGKLKSINNMLSEYPNKYWNKILTFTKIYFDINLPEINLNDYSYSHSLTPISESDSSFSQEYEKIINKNRVLAKEFILALHEYREKHVNPANLELEQLYFPQNLYEYLRNHHWKDSISKDFLHEWVKMKHSNKTLDSELKNEFIDLFMKLDIPMTEISNLLNLDSEKMLHPVLAPNQNGIRLSNNQKESLSFQEVSSSITSILDEFETKVFGSPQKRNKINSKSNIKEFSRFKNDLSNLIGNIESKFKNLAKLKKEKVSPLTKKEPIHHSKKDLIFIIDGANVARADIRANQKDSLYQIKQVRHQLLEKGASKIYILYDPSLKYSIDDKKGLLNMVENGLAKSTPARVEADDFILQHAKRMDAYIISNDKFEKQKYISRFGKDWISEKRCTFDVLDGIVELHYKVDELFQLNTHSKSNYN